MKLKNEMMPPCEALRDLHLEDGWAVHDGRTFGTYYRRHAETMQAVLPFVQRRGVVIQAGGHMGAYPRWLAKHFDRVYTFEPNPHFFRCLTLNAFLPNVYPMRAVLTDHNGCVNVGDWRVGEGVGPCPGITIDSLQLDACDLIALDIEGHELFALRGAYSTILRYAPVLLIEEARKDFGWFDRYQDLVKMIRGWGYRPVAHAGSDIIWRIE
jgi:hypothetical protein